ncbi:MAG: leucine--tRNA ligase [Candidatus Levybacteria bacterium]|nr:leucine--tRNA ligase [Candidatus Levybacteria bacterium]MBI2190122.1 leucine--tRNA ligase [Candidatus Levybacteria bacterium]MBI2622509.1 leucine--tRNA ligase [Candidatus Levybacteria bacterium]MBI3070177.1 leucine--tRNA ligase [Candidatus Levybacteria bacterium]MBI3092902.1 leucine--tRNA ligase [Candidatus Levybacteria bacterium]
MKYNPSEIEAKWQKKWEEEGSYWALDFDKRPKFYLLIEFPYPSGAGLHVGHVRSWSAMDAYGRKKRMEGYNVLYPIGWDAFGLPAENYAIKMGVHPSKIVPQNIARFKKQCKSLGLSFDWSREINTTDPKYYKWTQWIFLKFFEKGLAYRADVPVNWCPVCKTNLADEEVLADGAHERCGQKTQKRMQKQWLLKITAYADRLLEDLETVDYSSKIATQQVNWIGRKEGINILYEIEGRSEKIVCFTTRPDTNFGATFVVLAPEHPFVASLLNSKLKKMKAYVEKAKKKSAIERIAEGRKKTGVFTGLYCINQLNNYKMPLFISDFVLMEFGTGAVVGVPGHDKRDFEFAKKFNLPIPRVVVGKDGDTSEITQKEQVQEEKGTMINSDFLNGLDISEATKRIMDYLEEKGWGKRTVTYHMRDWVFSRQHYWGEPIPIIHCNQPTGGCGAVPVPEKKLPVELPYLEKYQPSGTGESPLALALDWVDVKCPKCGGRARRETDTMPNWAGSNWYYVRYLDPHNDKTLADKKKMDYWLPVDLYQGGFEHTTLHLLYSRFVYKFLYDVGAVPNPEPYAKRRSHGIVLGPDGRKMSKSFDNVVNPEDVVGKFGADTLRVYEMFMGPFDQTIAWSEEGVEGCFRFLKRVWRLSLTKVTQEKTPLSLLAKLNRTIKKVGQDIESLKFNTAVASMMEFTNEWQSNKKGLNKADLKNFLLTLAPFAPHMTEELWQQIRRFEVRGEKLELDSLNSRNRDIRRSNFQDQDNPISHFKDSVFESIHLQPWPVYDPKFLQEEEAMIVIQVNGKVRDGIKIKSEKLKIKNEIEKMAKKSERVRKYLEGKKVKQVVYVEGKIMNFVTEQ